MEALLRNCQGYRLRLDRPVLQERLSGRRRPCCTQSLTIVFCAWRRSMRVGRFQCGHVVVPLGIIGTVLATSLRV